MADEEPRRARRAPVPARPHRGDVIRSLVGAAPGETTADAVRRALRETEAPRAVRTIADVQREAVGRAMTAYDGNVAEAAKALGIGRATLYRWLARDHVSFEVTTGGAS